MARFLVEHNRLNCIGCMACSAQGFWEMNYYGKSDINNAETAL